jgi:hypothetical protein
MTGRPLRVFLSHASELRFPTGSSYVAAVREAAVRNGYPSRHGAVTTSRAACSSSAATMTDADDAYTPSAANTVMPAYSYGLGISSSLAHSGPGGNVL